MAFNGIKMSSEKVSTNADHLFTNCEQMICVIVFFYFGIISEFLTTCCFLIIYQFSRISFESGTLLEINIWSIDLNMQIMGCPSHFPGDKINAIQPDRHYKRRRNCLRNNHYKKMTR